MDFQASAEEAAGPRLPGLLEGTDAAFLASIPEARLSTVNTACGTILGYAPSELIGGRFFDFLHPQDRQNAHALLASASGQPWEMVARFLGKSGEYLWMEWRGQVHAGSWIVTGRDISRHVFLEQALAESEERFALAAESARLGTFDYYPGDGKLVCSRIACELAGLEPAFTKQGRGRSNLFPDPARGGTRAELSEFGQAECEQLVASLSLEDLSTAAETLLDLEADRTVNWVRKFKALDGVTRYIRVLASPVFDSRGALIHIRGTVQDVTEPETAKKRLREERNQFEAYLESAPEGVLSIDAAGRLLLVNSRIEGMFGYTRAELLGKSVDMLLPDRFARGHARRRASFFSAPGRRPMGQGITFPGRRKDGTEFPVEVGLNWVLHEDQVVALALVTDATVREAREAERQRMLDTLRDVDVGRRLDGLREHERKQIAREIHDGLGQELVALKIRLALLRSNLDAGSHQAAQGVGELMAQVESLIRMIQRMATSLGPNVLDRLGLAPALDWLASEFEINEGIACTRSIEEIDTDEQTATTILRVVPEFLTNVLRHAGATQVHLTMALKDGVIEVEIRDDGHGIQPEDLHKPTATGLAAARERIASAGGTMDVLGHPGEGTVIRLRLPQTERSS